MKLHDGELDITEGLVRRLLAEQFPHWADRPLWELPASGTENVMFRLGDDLVVRMPRMPGAAEVIRKEHRWLPWLAPRLPLRIPSPVGLGEPGEGFALAWSVYRWLDGTHDIPDLPDMAEQLGGFVAALQRAPIPSGAPKAYRGGSFASSDGYVRTAARDLDVPDALRIWDAALHLPVPPERPVWLHSDLLPPNLLTSNGRLSAVIDFGCAGIGDPASDLMPAWTVFDAATRPVFRARLDPDDLTWERGRAWALVFGLGAWHYYRVSDPAFAALGRQTVNRVLTDARSST
ncbi:aminoglycoside phosphotransferase family protein [Actinoplanes sp. NPDC051513]|uniref:aminoglycoside phosphotransferase family protein n=1 Tax=Actinoplanes sp. NPDC051513 TaxID=3363908 RepID=UPI0037996173